MGGELLSVDESAMLLHLRVSTVRAWILARRIPFVKLGRRVFLRRQDLNALIARSVIPASPEK
jgi:excisionase family DNA binding protein